ncbi:DUF945 family protein [Pelistega ratti]|uniref:DUF945 family protein n=1 Tax=Pelistega ratti TaxID=2652177 RepID=UPI00135AB1C6|nr:DUF945 family protein [Pelistega ratti]
MRKRYLMGGLAIALIIAYPVASHIHGNTIQARLDSDIQQLNQYIEQELQQSVRFSYEQTQSGIFTSQYMIKFKDEEGKEIPLLQQRIDHGPFPPNALKKGHFLPVNYASKITLINNDLTKAIFTVTQSEQPIVIEYVYGYDSKAKGYVGIAPINISQENLQLGATKISFNAKKDLTDSYFHIEMEPSKFAWLNTSGFIPQEFNHLGKIDMEMHYKLDEKGNLSVETQSDTDYYRFGDKETSIAIHRVKDTQKVTDDGKGLDISATQKAEQVLINDVDLGSYSVDAGYYQLDSGAIKSLGRTIYAIAFNYFNAAIAQKELLSPEPFLESRLFELGMQAIAIFNQNPKLQYGPIQLRNKAGASSVKAELDFVLPKDLNVTSPEEIYLKSLKKLDLQFVLNPAWLKQFTFDVLTVMAKSEKMPLPTDKDKADIDLIIDDMHKSAIESQFFQMKDNDLLFAVTAQAPEGKTIDQVEKISYNEQVYTKEDVEEILTTRGRQFIKLMEERDIESRWDELVERFQNPAE